MCGNQNSSIRNKDKLHFVLFVSTKKNVIELKLEEKVFG